MGGVIEIWLQKKRSLSRKNSNKKGWKVVRIGRYFLDLCLLIWYKGNSRLTPVVLVKKC